MSTRKLILALGLACTLGTGGAFAETPGLGKPISDADIAVWNIDVLPDGTGLPEGSGTAKQGAPIYAQKCALCHGENGVNPAPGILPLVGLSKFDHIDTMKTVPDQRGALCAHRLRALAQQDHRRERCDGRKEPSAGEDAEPE
jgi:cytochrome c553